jgi:hypothetical protein
VSDKATQATGIKLVTVSFDEDDGLEVDWDGVDEYTAWAYLSWACALLEDIIATGADE